MSMLPKQPRIILCSLIAVVALVSCRPGHRSTLEKSPREFDVVVYGGSASGVIAAITAAAEGQRVALLEPSRHLGGMVSSGLSRTDVGVSAVIGGRAKSFFVQVGSYYGQPVSWYFEPHVAESIFLQLIKDSGVAVFLQQRLATAVLQERRLTAVTTEAGSRFQARVFLDASYEGDLLAAAGVSFAVGREAKNDYGETLAGITERLYNHQFPPLLRPFSEGRRLLPLISRGDPGVPGAGDRKLPAYTYRLCLSNQENNRVPFPKPENYDPQRYELLQRYLETLGAGAALNDLMILFPLPHDKFDLNNRGPISTDYIGANWDYPLAPQQRRQEIEREHAEYVKGFLYYLAHDPAVPRRLKDEIGAYGLARDEFTDNDHWPYQLYVRESRRMKGCYVLRQDDVLFGGEQSDSVGMGSYAIDSHHVQRVPTADGGVMNEGDLEVPAKPYQIPYRCLTPQMEECDNLLVSVCISATHVAFSSVRMEPQFMILGQAAGLAAALAAGAGLPVQQIDVGMLQQKLRGQDQILSLADLGAAPLDTERIKAIQGLPPGVR